MASDVEVVPFSPYSRKLDAFYRLRAKSFAHWPEMRIEEGKERDQFDYYGANYLLLFDDEGELQAGLRLLPCTGPTLTSEVFPHMLPEPLPYDPATTYEVTRLCTRSPNRRIKTASLFIALARYCNTRGIRHVMGTFDLSMLRVYQGAGLKVHVMYQDDHGASGYFDLHDV